MSDARDDFYIGYLPDAPRALGSWLRRTTVGLVAVALAIGLTLAAGQRTSAPSVYEFEPTTLEGFVHLEPHPHLVIPRPGLEAGASTYLLTVFGKVGAEDALTDLEGHRVRLTGSLIHREGHVILEFDPASIERLLTGGPHVETARDLGELTLEGEIADAKCYLGVMKPGRGKIHKSCAIRCISGGVPPVLVVEDGTNPDFLLLVDLDGHPVGPRLLDFVAEPVRITGQHERLGGLDVLRIDPGTIERLSGAR